MQVGEGISMKGMIDNINFWELEPQRYYAPPNSWSQEKKHDTAVSRIFSGEWLGSQKRDGAFYKFIKDENGNMALLGRSKSVSGDYLDKIDWVPHLHDFFNALPNGTCLIGELYLPRDEQAKTTTSIMNCLKEKAIGRQAKPEDKLHYYVFDILAIDGKSVYTRPAQDRFNLITWLTPTPYVELADYKSGKELWELLQNLLADGYEGVVITRAAAPYQPGKRPSKDCLKVKKELQDTIDCVVIGASAPRKDYTGTEIRTWPYWFDQMTNQKVYGEFYNDYADGKPILPVTKTWYNGWAGSFRLGAYKDGKLIEIGNLSGITDEMKEHWQDWVGKVIEITAMEIMESENGYGLRHPKYVGERMDKAAKECTWESIFGDK